MAEPPPLAFSLVVPAYNEAARLPANMAPIERCCEELTVRFGAWEVLVIVERSTDGTLEKTRAASADCPAVEVLDNGAQRGKGHAVRNGMLRAKGDVILFMDADLSTPLEAVGRFLDYFRAHPEVDIVIGNRRHRDSQIAKAQGPLRQMLSGVFNLLVRRFAMPGAAGDTQCGFKAFRRAAAQAVFSRQQLDGFSFDVEALLIAQGLGFKVADLPVQWSDAAATKLRVMQDGWRMLVDLLVVRRSVAARLRAERLAG